VATVETGDGKSIVVDKCGWMKYSFRRGEESGSDGRVKRGNVLLMGERRELWPTASAVFIPSTAKQSMLYILKSSEVVHRADALLFTVVPHFRFAFPYQPIKGQRRRS
jgi:hypothetical protein